MATKNLVPRGDLEGKLGLYNRRWKEVNAETGEFTTLRIDALKNRNDHDLLVSSDQSVTIERIGPGLTNDEGAGFQYNLTTSGGSGSSSKIFEGTSPDQNIVKTVRSGGESKILFTIGGIPDTGWEIDENGHMLPYADDSNNIGNVNKQVKEVFLMNDALTFESGKINVSNSKRLQFGIPDGNSYIYDDISLTKSSVKVATTAEFSNWTYDATNGLLISQTGVGYMGDIDSEAINNDDRILVKDQTNKIENGIYKVLNKGDSGNTAQLKRVDDLLTGADFIGTSVSVLEGTDNKQKLFFVTPPASGGSIVGTHHQNWITFGDSLNTSGVQTTIQNMFDSSNQFTFNSNTGKFQTKLSLNDLTDVNVGTTLDGNDDDKVLQWNWNATSGTGEFGLATVTSGGTPRTNNEIQDLAAGLLTGGTNTGISFSYDATNNVLTSSVTDSDNFVKKNETTTFGDDPASPPTYDFHAKSVVVKVPAPTANEHAVNKQYVDTAMQGIDEVLTPVKAASIGNVVLADLISGYSSIDGTAVVLNTGDRVLLKDQTTASENGVYVVGATGVGGGNNPTVRATDLAAGAQANAVFIFVEEGTQNANSGFICTSPTTSDTVGTDDLTFVKFSSAGQINAGNALTLTGQDLDVNVDGTTIVIDNDQLQVGTIGFDNISGSLPADMLPGTVLTTGSTITATSITAGGITGIHTMSGIITTLEDADGFIINDSSDTDTNGNTTTDQVKRGAAGRILEYVQSRFIGDISVSKEIDNSDGDKIKLDVTLNSNAFTTKDLLSNTNTDSASSTYDDDNKLQPDDLFLISDHSAQNNAVRKVKFSDISAASLDIVGLEDTNNNTAPFTGNDYLPIYENTSESNRKITVNKLMSTLGVRPLAFKHVDTSTGDVEIVTNTHYNIKLPLASVFSYNFYFYDNSASPFSQFVGNDGDIVKITLTPNDSAQLSEEFPGSGLVTLPRRLNAFAAIRVNVKLNKDENILYTTRDLNKPIEFVYTVDYNALGVEIAGSGKWRPYVGNPVNVPFDLHIYESSQLTGFLTSHYLFTSSDDVYISFANSSEMSLNLPSAETAYAWGMKHGETKTFHFMSKFTRKATFISTVSDIAKLSPRAANKAEYLSSRASSKTLVFGTDIEHIRKVKVKLHTFISSNQPNNTQGIRHYFWDIDGIDTINILPADAASKHLLIAQTASPAVITTGFLKDENIDVDAEISFSKLDKIVDANRLLGSTTADGTVSEVQVATGMISDDAVTNSKLNNMARGTVKVGGTANAPTDLVASGDAKILIGDATDIKSVAVTGDISIDNAGATTIADAAVTTGKIQKIENKKVLGSLLNTGANSGETNPITSINIIDDLTTFISNDASKHTNLVTATAVKNFFRDSSQTAGFPNVRSVYATMNTTDIMTVGDTGNTTSVASGSNTIVGTVQLTIDDVETGVVLRKHDTNGVIINEDIKPVSYPVQAIKVGFKGDLSVNTGALTRQYVNYLMGNVDNNVVRYDAGTITDSNIFSAKAFRNCYRIQLPHAETFFNKYGTTESLILQMEGDFGMSDWGAHKAVGMVILPQPSSLGNRLIGTQTITANDFDWVTDPFVFIDSYQNGKYVFTNEGNYFFASQVYRNFGAAPIQETHITVSISMSLKTNVPIGTYKSGENNPEILGYVPSAYVWTIRKINPIEM
jgi:hypothetical protein